MNCDRHQKVSASHLQRDAYLYVRQSTLRQVLENTESTHRQYALRQQAVALGWPIERVIVIDPDPRPPGPAHRGGVWQCAPRSTARYPRAYRLARGAAW